METLIMNVSQLINMLNRQIKEGDMTDSELKFQNNIASRNHFKAEEKSKKDKEKEKDRPDAKMNPKQLRNKNKNLDDDFEEDDNPMDMFNKQISDQMGQSKEASEEEQEEQPKQPDKNTNIKNKSFNLEYAKNYDKFVKIVNTFRSTESIRDDEVVKKYWENLSLAEKQAVYVFFDNLTHVSDSEKEKDFKMPKTPIQLGIHISPAGQSQQQTKDQAQKNQDTVQKQHVSTVKQKPTNIEIEKKPDNTHPITPITVGESHKRYISIDALLKEVK